MATDPFRAGALALKIARCPEIAACVTEPAHPCQQVVRVQGPPLRPGRHVPEAWSGGLETARVLYLSSNPSISEAGDSNSGGTVEDYPLTEWPDDRIAEFITRRFDQTLPLPWATEDRFRRADGTMSNKRVPYWREARKRSSELLGYDADPAHDYAMTEVVRCKSKKETGVANAAKTCADNYLDSTLALSPAPLLVVVGAKSRARFADLFPVPDGFGTTGSPPQRNMTVLDVGGRERACVYLPHFTGMAKGGKSFTVRFGASLLLLLRDIALGVRPPRELLGAAREDEPLDRI